MTVFLGICFQMVWTCCQSLHVGAFGCGQDWGAGKQRALVTNAGCPLRLFVELSPCWVPLTLSIPTPLQMEIAATFTDEKINKRSPARKGELGQECRLPDSQAYLGYPWGGVEGTQLFLEVWMTQNI